MNKILITESVFDEAVIKRMLPKEVTRSIMVTSRSGDTAALSAARSYYVDGGYQIVLLVDSDSNNEQEIASKKYEYEGMISSLGRRSSDAKIVLINPEIEALFFESKDFIEKTFGRQLSDLEFEFLKKDPKTALQRLAQDQPNLPQHFKELGNVLLDKLDEATIERIRQNEQIQEIIEYFQK